MPTEPTGTARLTGVVIRSTDLDHDTAVFTAITGATPSPPAEEAATPVERAVFAVDDAQLTLLPSDGGQRGIERFVIEVADLDATHDELRSAGSDATRNGDCVQIDSEWAGVKVELRAQTAEQDRSTQPAGAELDHVAILVADTELMAQRWTAIVGAPPAHAGVHPLGTTMAARFMLGDRMIELLAPLPDTPSPLRTRLDQVGDSPFALAIIANDLDATTKAVAAAGARLLDQPPHIVVHPSDASGVPIQLTPRVNH